MHRDGRVGIAAHWLYKGGDHRQKLAEEWLGWVRQLIDWEQDEADPQEFMKTVAKDLFDEEVFVFTPKWEVKRCPAGATPIDFAYAVHTDVGHRTVGAKVNGRIVPLHYQLQSGDMVEVLTSKSGRGPSRDWLSLAAVVARAQQDPPVVLARDARGHRAAWPRDARARAEEAEPAVQEARRLGRARAGHPRDRLQEGRGLLPRARLREAAAGQIVNKLLQRLKTHEVVEEEAVPLKAPKAKRAVGSNNLGIRVEGTGDVLVRLAKCCTPVPGDEIVGYISLGKGITIHRDDCPNVKALRRNPERFTPVDWEGAATQSFRVQIAVDAWDRPRLLEDVARTFAEYGANIVEYGGHVEDQLAKNWYTAEIGDVRSLRSLLNALRHLDAVFDANRVTPTLGVPRSRDIRAENGL